MYELIQVGERSYYINCPVKMGIFLLGNHEVCLIDSGNDKDAGKKILKILASNGWTLKMILNTHSHADHIGGNRFLQQRTGCRAYTAGIDRAFSEFPVLEPSLLYGGFPCKALRNKFLCAQESEAEALTEEILPEGLSLMRIDGHSPAMAAFKTCDGVWFLGDCLTSGAIIEKYPVSYIYDVRNYLETLEAVKKLEGKLFIPAHAEPTENIVPLADLNASKVEEICSLLLCLCRKPSAPDEILKAVFDHYALTMDFSQYVLVGSTVRSYLSYLHEEGSLSADFENNKLYWTTIKK
ncbi:MAG: MBL fold metallo-hydrolase [Oscillospiraceae bacterium]